MAAPHRFMEARNRLPYFPGFGPVPATIRKLGMDDAHIRCGCALWVAAGVLAHAHQPLDPCYSSCVCRVPVAARGPSSVPERRAAVRGSYGRRAIIYALERADRGYRCRKPFIIYARMKDTNRVSVELRSQGPGAAGAVGKVAPSLRVEWRPGRRTGRRLGPKGSGTHLLRTRRRPAPAGPCAAAAQALKHIYKSGMVPIPSIAELKAGLELGIAAARDRQGFTVVIYPNPHELSHFTILMSKGGSIKRITRRD
jgi:hypothetical protein